MTEEWWNLFDDDQLSAFIQQSFYANSTLDRAKASLFPNFNLGGDILREKLSETGLIPFNTPSNNNTTIVMPPPLITPVTAGSNGIPVYFTQYETEVTLSYEFDLWRKTETTGCQALDKCGQELSTKLFPASNWESLWRALTIDCKLPTKEKRLHKNLSAPKGNA